MPLGNSGAFFVFMWVVYILYSAKLDKYYVGRTANIELRLKFHNNPIEKRKFTARGVPWVLRLAIPCQTQVQSIRLEKLIKQQKSRRFIELLLSSESEIGEILRRASPDY